MQRDENLVYINGVNGQQIDAIHIGYRQTGAVYTRWSGSVQIHPDRPPISVRARIGSNSIPKQELVRYCHSSWEPWPSDTFDDYQFRFWFNWHSFLRIFLDKLSIPSHF